MYGTEDHFVWASSDRGKTWQAICQLKTNCNTILIKVKNTVLRNGIVRKIRKNIGISNLVVLKSGTIIAQYDQVYRFAGNGNYALPVFDFKNNGVTGPLKNGLMHDKETGNIYFGEYSIKRPKSVKIVRGTDDGQRWEVCYQFDSGQIRHVHGLYSDPYRGRIWICTGDNDEESGLYYTDDHFITVKRFGGGDQMWRAVSLIVTPDHLFYGTDAGQDATARTKNFIFKLDISTGKRTRLCCIDKPAYYSAKLANGTMCIATTFEPKIKRKIEPSADIWISKNGEDWNLYKTFEYKFAGRKYGTKYGTLIIPHGKLHDNQIYCTLMNVKKLDFHAVKVLI